MKSLVALFSLCLLFLSCTKEISTSLNSEMNIEDTLLSRYINSKVPVEVQSQLDILQIHQYKDSRGLVVMYSIPFKNEAGKSLYFDKRRNDGLIMQLELDASRRISRIRLSDISGKMLKHLGVYEDGRTYDIYSIVVSNVAAIGVATVINYWDASELAFFNYVLNPWTVLNPPSGATPDYLNLEYVLPDNSGSNQPPLVTGIEVIEVEYYFGPHEPADIREIFNCFDNLSSTGATYTMTLNTDVPVNSNPNMMVDPYDGFSPGHVFITLTKTNGPQSITKSFGFYPRSSGLSASTGSTPSTIVNDFNHEINASLTMSNLSAGDFNLIKQTAINNATLDYNLSQNNCTDYALKVFNSVRPSSNRIETETAFVSVPFLIDRVPINQSPQKLFKTLNNMKSSGGAEANAITINTTRNYKSPNTPGECQ